jgi:hypothetical protein
MLFHPFAAGLTERSALLWVAQQVEHGLGQCLRIAGRDQQTRDAILYCFWDAPGTRCYDGFAQGHGVQYCCP